MHALRTKGPPMPEREHDWATVCHASCYYHVTMRRYSDIRAFGQSLDFVCSKSSRWKVLSRKSLPLDAHVQTRSPPKRRKSKKIHVYPLKESPSIHPFPNQRETRAQIRGYPSRKQDARPSEDYQKVMPRMCDEIMLRANRYRVWMPKDEVDERNPPVNRILDRP
jgi:hypothetical protein